MSDKYNNFFQLFDKSSLNKTQCTLNLYNKHESVFKDDRFLTNFVSSMESNFNSITRNLIVLTDHAVFERFDQYKPSSESLKIENLNIICLKDYLDGRDMHSFIANIEGGPKKYSTSQYRSAEEASAKNKEAEIEHHFWMDAFEKVKIGFFNVNLKHEFVFFYVPSYFIKDINLLFDVFFSSLPQGFNNIIIDYSKVEHPMPFIYDFLDANIILISNARMYQAQYFIE